MRALVEQGEDQTVLRCYGSRMRPVHLLAALLAFFGALTVFYLIGVGDRGVWLGLSILFGFVFVGGFLSYREARGAVIRVTPQELALPAAATPSRSERVLLPHDIRTVRRILFHYRRGRRTLCILEIEAVNGSKLRLWPSMVATEDLAKAIQRHMGIAVETKSGLLYQLGFGLLILLALGLIAWVMVAVI